MQIILNNSSVPEDILKSVFDLKKYTGKELKPWLKAWLE
jgi:hypothetical protein